MAESKPYRWRFIQHRVGGARSWLWQRFGPDGRLEKTSEPHQKYGKAVRDAINHGFRPAEDVSSVDLAHGTMHFPLGMLRCTRKPPTCGMTLPPVHSLPGIEAISPRARRVVEQVPAAVTSGR